MNNINKFSTVLFFALVAVGVFYSCAKDKNEAVDVVTENNFASTKMTDFSNLLRKNGIIVKDQLIETILTNSVVNNPTSQVCRYTKQPGEICVTQVVFDQFPYPGDINCPGCNEVSVNFTVTFCYIFTPPNSLNVTNISFSDFNGDATGSTCGLLKQCWFNMPSAEASKAVELFLQTSSKIAEYRYMQSFLSTYNINCPTKKVIADFYRQICYESCFTLLDGPPFFKLSLATCGTKCCKRSTEYCKMPSGQSFSGAPVYSSVGTSDCRIVQGSQCKGEQGFGCNDFPCGTN